VQPINAVQGKNSMPWITNTKSKESILYYIDINEYQQSIEIEDMELIDVSMVGKEVSWYVHVLML